MFSKQTSKAASAWDVNAMRVSPDMSLGLPYSLPTASLIWGWPSISDRIAIVNGNRGTDMHVDHLPITFLPIDDGGNQH